MKTNLFFTLIFSIGFLYPANVLAQTTYLHCGNLIDAKSNEPQKEMTIIVEGNKIMAIEKGYKNAPANAKTIDLKTKTVMPGWIDLHVHIESQTSKNQFVERMTLNQTDVAYRAAKYAETTLMAGFTTVRDMGGSAVSVSLRNAINQNLAKGPRLFVARKSIAPTGGHADPTNGIREDLAGDPGPENGVINGPDDCRKAVRYQLKNGADWIKITATGGVLSIAKDGFRPQFTEEEIKAVVETASDLGVGVAAHAHGAEGMKRAIRAGITSIEHGTILDDEVLTLMKQKGTYLVATLMASQSTLDSAKITGYYHNFVKAKILEISPKHKDSFTKAYKAGVKIAFGTDAGVFAHGKNAQEFRLMNECGMPVMETIKAATIEAAKLLKQDDKIGTIEQGKLADIVAVNENPLQNIRTMEKVSFVMKDGVVFKNEL
jgi:imidazolonepropionase-like amidohydrolase